jgi:alkanesulfonate monooxygenase SsuD/methylene tetrahydromethanopterin reductase-like flavin-dependent oxidoreductase (luciferase family)
VTASSGGRPEGTRPPGIVHDGAMQMGIVLTVTDPRLAADLAAEAEAAGWDGVFTYDAIAIGDMDGFDPWILLSAIAVRTSRVRIGAIVFAPSRRRPWKLARELATLDVLSGGRVVFPVGLGALDDKGFGAVGEPVEARTRASLLDETLAIIDGLASGEPFTFSGDHYRVDGVRMRPTPVQRPRVPVWVVGAWPRARSMRRAARWDGIVVQADDDGTPAGQLETLVPIVDWLRRERGQADLDGPYDVVLGGTTPPDPEAAGALMAPLGAAGATWWIEQDWSAGATAETLRARILAGPPARAS